MFISRRAATALLAGATLAGCTSAGGEDDAAPVVAASAALTPSPAATEAPTPAAVPTPASPAAPSPTPSAAASQPAVTSPVSLPALMAKTYDGRGLSVGRVLDRQPTYTRYYVTYLSGKLRISGILNVPKGKGPFPTLVLAHGHIDLDIYTNGRGLKREQDYLAKRGYVVLHTDYRNHASSGKDPSAETNLRLGYTDDVINAVLALRASKLPAVDGKRIGLLGRSMGGGVVLNTLVAKPGLVDAAVLYSSVSSTTYQNFQRWTAGSAEGSTILRKYSTPAGNPTFWKEVSPVTYADRITEPVLIHHGTVDRTCPPQWSQDTYAALRKAGVDTTLYTYPGQDHAFDRLWAQSMQRTVAFFAKNLKG